MSEEKKIWILIVDDHLVVREGLATLLEPFSDLQVVGKADNGSNIVKLCQTLEPDVVLMDLVMPHVDGVEATKRIREHCPGVQVLALTSFKDDRLVRGVLEAGAVGYLLKNVGANELAEAIRDAYRGQPTIAPEASQVLIETMRAPAPPGKDLTEREQEVLQLLAHGLSNSEIGEQLDISPHTVKNHLRSIYTKLGVSTRAAATRVAIKYDLIDEN
ncbi:MAG TPA: response regulator transcription factor [Candidatus Sulfomarinibacteraceae bacterium]|nr:response regulator transcription factor [Candidatus Sulfomarinibacteraceae bacterium]